MSNNGDYIAVDYNALDTAAEALEAEHRELDRMKDELRTRVQRATWNSQSQGGFDDLLREFERCVIELHSQLNNLAGALRTAGVNMFEIDRYIATHTFGGVAAGGPAPGSRGGQPQLMI